MIRLDQVREFVDEEVRRIMAQLGLRKFEDMVGRVDRLGVRKAIEHWKARGLDFSAVFRQPDTSGGKEHCFKNTGESVLRFLCIIPADAS